MKNNYLMLLFATSVFLFSYCKEKEDEYPETPPTLELKSGNGYTSADANVGKGAMVKVGIIATKTEDDLQTFNVSYAYDGASTTVSRQTVSISSANSSLFETDIEITTRNQTGSEKWYFTITDVDGNIVQKSIVLGVN